MDPLESIARYRQQETGGGRALKIAPPPTMPMAPTVPEAPTMPGPAGAEPVEPVEPAGAAGPVGERRVRGNARGRKQLLYVYLPGPTIDRLDDARAAHGTLGAAVMASLRGSYHWLVATHPPEPAEAVGPFPATRGPRRRQGLDGGRLKPFYVTPEEAQGIDTLAEQLEMSMSELVTVAVDHWFGDGAPPS
jgi:hypothetical protein